MVPDESNAHEQAAELGRLEEARVRQSAQSWLAEGKSFDEIQALLNDTGLSAEDVDSVMKQVKDQRYESQPRKGLPLIGIGAMLCVLGCVVTILTTDPGGAGFHFALYGMTGFRRNYYYGWFGTSFWLMPSYNVLRNSRC